MTSTSTCSPTVGLVIATLAQRKITRLELDFVWAGLWRIGAVDLIFRA